MRDIALTLLIAGLLPFVFKRPEIGAYMWAWISIMNPHKLAYGFAHSAPFALVIAAVTLFAFLFTKSRKPLPLSGVMVIYLVLLVWMTITSLFALNTPEYVLARWTFVMKIHLMLVVTIMLIRGRKQIEVLLWVVVGSVAFYGVKGGLYTLATAGSGRVWGPPGGMIEGNNELAVALVMLTPFMYYLHQTATKRWLRTGLVISMASIALAILGTQSRGALLALLAMAFVLGLKGKNPIRTSIFIVALMALIVGFMPDSWTSRMDTIQTYQADTSAMSRIYTWITLWNLALDRPIVGGGFGTDTLAVFQRYAPTAPPYDIFTGTKWVAHSIYVQALGEHGFPGLALYLLLGLLTWHRAGAIARQTRVDPEFGSWVPLLMRMCQVALIGFATGGAFLSLMHLDVPYYIFAIVVLVGATVKEGIKLRLKQPQAATGAVQGLRTASP